MARGDLSKSPGNGKKIDTFEYEVVQVDGFEPIRLKIDVHMSKDFEISDSNPKPVRGASFNLICEGERVEGSDIDACIKAMRAKLDKRFKIKWQNWLKVSINKETIYQGSGSGLSLRWERVERGVAHDGTHLMRTYYGYNGKTWKVEPWPEYFKDRNGKTLACIPETSENVEALETFAKKIDEMRKVLAEFVSPEQIEETLRQIAGGGMNLLPNRS